MFRNTIQKQIILEELKRVRTHPTATEIYDRVRIKIPKVSLGTVYRNLEKMSEEGQVLKLQQRNIARYDGFTHSHAHFFCKECQKVYDLPEIKLKLNKKLLETRMGITIAGKNIELKGICKECKKINKNLGSK
jgi:Fur family ferric uptake transcriptional regulator